jgi:hypothetical protein
MPRTQYWNEQRLKEGLDRYFHEHGRYPTTPEIDACGYLPSTRQISRAFGGAKALRELLGHEVTDFGSGVFRSKIATKIGRRGIAAEQEIGLILIEKFGVEFVHFEKTFSDRSKNRVDAFVYSPSGLFGIDVFFTETERNLSKIISIKIEAYRHFPSDKLLYFVCANSEMKQEVLDRAQAGVKKAINIPQLRVVSKQTLTEIIAPMRRYIALPIV